MYSPIDVALLLTLAPLQNLQAMIASPDILPEAKLRLAILYALRYQKLPQNQISTVIDLLKQQHVPDAEVGRTGSSVGQS